MGRGVVPRDPYPQWRQVSWSPDNTMVACSRSNGTVDVFDIVGTQLFTISGVSNYRQGDMFDIVGTHLFTISGVSTYIGQADDISMPYKFLSI